MVSLSYWHQLLKVIRLHAVKNLFFSLKSFSHCFTEKKNQFSFCLFSFCLMHSLNFLLGSTMNLDFCLWGLFSPLCASTTEVKSADISMWTLCSQYEEIKQPEEAVDDVKGLTVHGRCAQGAWPRWRWQDTHSWEPTWHIWTLLHTQRDLKRSKWADQIRLKWYYNVLLINWLKTNVCTSNIIQHYN